MTKSTNQITAGLNESHDTAFLPNNSGTMVVAPPPIPTVATPLLSHSNKPSHSCPDGWVRAWKSLSSSEPFTRYLYPCGVGGGIGAGTGALLSLCLDVSTGFAASTFAIYCAIFGWGGRNCELNHCPNNDNPQEEKGFCCCPPSCCP